MVIVILAITMVSLVGVLIWLFFDKSGAESNTIPTPESTPTVTAKTIPTTTVAPVPEPTAATTTAPSQPTAANGTIRVEDEVKTIRDLYNTMENDCSSGMVSVKDYNDAQIYDNGKGMIKAVAPSGANGIPYEQYYYYNSGKLIFAYYEAHDSYRFYFSGNLYNEKLIRLRYCADASNYSDAVNHDMENTDEYRNWEKTVRSAAQHYMYW